MQPQLDEITIELGCFLEIDRLACLKRKSWNEVFKAQELSFWTPLPVRIPNLALQYQPV